MRRFLILSTMLLVASISASGGSADLYSDFDSILAATVESELVDYVAIRDQYAEALEQVLDLMAAVDPSSLSTDDRLAFLINLYNANMIKVITEKSLPGYSPSDDGFKVFKDERVRYDGRMTSLDEIENQLIRPVFDEPRIHVALVCGARSCPPILNRAWRGKNIEQTFEAQMKAFVNDSSRNRIDRQKKTLELSKIFEWFADDFGGKDAVAAYVDQYTAAETGGYSVAFSEYSWELNIVDR